MPELKTGQPRPENDNYRILVLVEEPAHMQLIVESCKKLKQEVVPVQTIEAALKFLETKDHVDACIAEAFLQNESSFDFLSRMKKLPGHKDVPVMLVALAPGEVARFCRESMETAASVLGAYKFLIMPDFDLDQMIREVQSLLPVKKIPKKEADPTSAN
ncbi:hypothetical protein BH10CYA1_BH10CYA1_40290 [soil metagenome]